MKYRILGDIGECAEIVNESPAGALVEALVEMKYIDEKDKAKEIINCKKKLKYDDAISPRWIYGVWNVIEL